MHLRKAHVLKHGKVIIIMLNLLWRMTRKKKWKWNVMKLTVKHWNWRSVRCFHLKIIEPNGNFLHLSRKAA